MGKTCKVFKRTTRFVCAIDSKHGNYFMFVHGTSMYCEPDRWYNMVIRPKN
jgi:hypothetical protein